MLLTETLLYLYRLLFKLYFIKIIHQKYTYTIGHMKILDFKKAMLCNISATHH